MYGHCFNGDRDSNRRGGIMMYMDNGMLAFLMMLLLGIDIFPTIEDIEEEL